MRRVNAIARLVQQEEVEDKHDDGRECGEAEVDAAVAELAMLEGGADCTEHDCDKNGRHNKEQHLLAGVLVALLTLCR